MARETGTITEWNEEQAEAEGTTPRDTLLRSDSVGGASETGDGDGGGGGGGLFGTHMDQFLERKGLSLRLSVGVGGYLLISSFYLEASISKCSALKQYLYQQHKFTKRPLEIQDPI